MERTSTPARRDTTLDVLRMVAALGVVATHARWLAHTPSGRTATFADALHASLWQGSRTTVYIFFALSGFLIARPFLTALLDGTPLPSSRAYAVRRVTRIVPAYWLAFTAFLVFGFGVGARVGGVLDHYLLIHNEIPGDAGTLLPVAWTLGIEASFYVAVPLVAALVRRRTAGPIPERRLLAWIAVVTGGSVALHLAVFTRPLPTGWGSVLQYTLPAQLLFFTPGIVLAVVEHRRRRPVISRQVLLAGSLAAAAGWVACMWLFVVSTTIPAGISSIGFALLSGAILGLARWSPEPRSRLGRAAVWVGTVSYGLYLWHWLVMRAMYGWWGAAFAGTRTISWPLSTAVVFTLTLPVAAASWYFLERPLMRWASARVRPAPAAPVPAPPPAAADPVPALDDLPAFDELAPLAPTLLVATTARPQSRPALSGARSGRVGPHGRGTGL
jgi:peptidoglycan/LPS O-acetylase OafA/YrhL